MLKDSGSHNAATKLKLILAGKYILASISLNVQAFHGKLESLLSHHNQTQCHWKLKVKKKNQNLGT